MATKIVLIKSTENVDANTCQAIVKTIESDNQTKAICVFVDDPETALCVVEA